MQYSITLHRTLFVQGWCDVLEQDRTVESSTPYGIGMFSLRNGLLQKSAFLRHNRCIELEKRYIKALALSNSRLVPYYAAMHYNHSPVRKVHLVKDHVVYVYWVDKVYVQNNLPTELSKRTLFII